MTTWAWFALAVVLAAWMGTGFLIRRWGPGRVRRRVLCPEKKVHAQVVALRTEAGFGAIQTTDIVGCDLLTPGPVNCGKRCMVRL